MDYRDIIKGGLLGFTTDTLGAPVDLVSMAMRPFGYKTQKPVMGSDWLAEKLNAEPRTTEGKAARLAGGLLSPDPMDIAKIGGLLAHTVYHGSPHKFNKFDMSKIGTGEGAQAYGHGLYFAEAPDVAKSYIPPNTQAQETIAGLLKKETARAQRYSNEGGMEVYEMFNKGYTPAGIRANIDNLIESGEAHPDYIKKMEQAYKKATEIYKANPAGQMYKVDIPDESIPKMLDWDRSLDQQSPEVIAALEKVGITQPWELVSDTGHALGRTFKTQAEALAEAPAGWTTRVRPSTNKGNAVYENLAAQVGKAGRYDNPLPKDYAATSELLKQAGIPGIKYLDAISRGAGDGSRNFVLFQDDLARILEVNGQPTGLTPWGAGEFGGLLTR